MINRAPLRGAFIFGSRLAEGLGEELGGSPRRRARPATGGSAAEADSPRRKGGREQVRSSLPQAQGRTSVKARTKVGAVRPVPQAATRRPQPAGGRMGTIPKSVSDIGFVPTAGGVGLGKRSAAAARRRKQSRVLPPTLSPPTSRMREVVFQIRKHFLIWKKATGGGGRALLNLPR